MRLEEPSWWYANPGDLRPTLIAWALQPAAALYDRATIWRHRLGAHPYQSRLPVICIGNFTAGGTGKTPLAIHIAKHLAAQGRSPAFLTRGFGGKRAGPHWVAAAADTAEDVGDEALLLAAHAPTIVARDRAAGARAIEDSSASVIVMDDGLQNPGLFKSLSLAVVDGQRGVGNGRVIPAGPLRAGLAFQVALVDAVIINGGVARSPMPLGALGWTGPVIHMATAPVAGTLLLAGKRFVAFAGIGQPEQFFETARKAGADVVATAPFPDHHAYTARDAANLIARARSANAGLLTTQKDLVRLLGDFRDAADPRHQLASLSNALPIEVVVAAGDTLTLHDLLARAISSPS